MPTGRRGRPWLIGWPDLRIVQVIKRYVGRKLMSVERRLAHGCMEAAERIMRMTQVGLGVINTAYVERLNATFRAWMPALWRRSRRPARMAGRVEAAMAADLTDHVWTVDEMRRFRPRRE